MDSVAITIGSGWTLGGLLLIAVALPLARGKVARNALYGIRFPQSLRSDEAWFAINRYGGRRLVVWAIPLILIGVVSFFLPLRSHAGLALTLGFAPLLLLLIPLVESWRFARRYRPKE
jgi:hypothetical protein